MTPPDNFGALSLPFAQDIPELRRSRSPEREKLISSLTRKQAQVYTRKVPALTKIDLVRLSRPSTGQCSATRRLRVISGSIERP